MQLADKATRTSVMLTERLRRTPWPGQQQIVVKHVTVNADQAVVTTPLSRASLRVMPRRPRSPGECRREGDAEARRDKET